MPGFYELGPLRQTAVNLFYGWGYNFYRKENQFRADDLLVRAKAGALLLQAAQAVAAAEAAYRREKLPPPSREKPRPDAAAVAGAQALERMGQAIAALEGQIRAQPVPEGDRMTQRFRSEAQGLVQLLQADEVLVGQAELLRAMLAEKDAGWMLEHAAAVAEGVKAISQTLRERQAVLLG
jgi:hypothetical protein